MSFISTIKQCYDQLLNDPQTKTTDEEEANNPVLQPFRLANVLHYESYDETTQIFHNQHSVGFILQLSPMVGADESDIAILSALITDGIPAGVDIQCLLYASPDIQCVFKNWLSQRDKGPLPDHAAWLANARYDFLKASMLSPCVPDQSLLRDFQVYFVISVAKTHALVKNDKALGELIQCRDDIKSSLKSVQLSVSDIDVNQFIALMQQYLTPQIACERDDQHNDKPRLKTTWDRFNPLSQQLTDTSQVFRVTSNHVSVQHDSTTLVSEKNPNHEHKKTGIVCLCTKQIPSPMAQWKMGEVLGHLFNTALQIPCPFWVSVHVRTLDPEQSTPKAQYQFLRKDSTLKSPLAKFQPKLSKEHHDWQYVRDRLSEGDRLAKLHYQVILTAPPSQLGTCERKVMDVYRALGWTLIKPQYLQLQHWLASLPMRFSEGMYEDFQQFGLLKTMTAANAVQCLPLQGEWKGMATPRLMLPGRRGQIAFFDPFDNQEGNYNVAVTAKSGAGKSAFIQEDIVAQVTSGGRVWVMDVGRSYEKTCRLLGGQFMAFSTENPPCLNPFTHIQSLDESIDSLIPLFALMASPRTPLTPDEETYLEQAIKGAWLEKKNKATVTTVSDWLVKQSNLKTMETNAGQQAILQRLSHLLYSYTKDGRYGKYFEGACDLDFNNPFVVLELEELKGKEQLQAIVLLTLMHQITEAMYLGERSIQKSCIIDEAWDLLGDGDSRVAKFIETGYRRARRYYGRFVSITQSINDYFKHPAAIAAFENADWKIILSQKGEAIDALKTTERFHMDGHTERLLRSLRKTEHYSECLIKGPNGVSVHRILFDPIARILYSSKGDDYTRVKALEDKGYSLKEAIEAVAADTASHT